MRNDASTSLRENPFEVLYVSEVLQPKEFVRLFSPFLVNQMLPLFQPGNVVLKGTVGSGKSMLLDLLRPEIRLAYSNVGEPFPVPSQFSRFIGSGINFKHMRIDEFGLVDATSLPNPELLPLLIVDYLNWAIVQDILRSVKRIRESHQAVQVREELLEKHTKKRFDDFARVLSNDPCWFGALEGVKTLESLEERVESRLTSYRRFANLIADLPEDILRARTSAGQPVEAAAKTLRHLEVLKPDTQIFVRLDQYETLLDLHRVADEAGSAAIRREINRFLDLRTPEVHFRVGVRRYAWEEVQDFGAEKPRLEKERAYRELDIDRILRRSENGPDLFLRFAEDVVRRRLTYARVDLSARRGGVLKQLFGQSEGESSRAKAYVRSASEQGKALHLDGLSGEWRNYLLRLSATDPFEAQLGCAWAHQKRGSPPHLPSVNGAKNTFPWTKEYWRKERRHQALLQIAVAHRQRITWAGAEDVRLLSGENILVFVSLCRFTWSAWERSLSVDERRQQGYMTGIPQIPGSAQRIGLEDGSRYWFTKVREQPGGDSRQAFISTVARDLRERLIADQRMSYPGHTGFSVEDGDLNRAADVQRFLRDAVDAGDLIDSEHRTKERNKAPRHKFYVQAILCPHLQLPAVKTKEPLYVRVGQIRDWITQSREEITGNGTVNNLRAPSEANQMQGILFPEFDEA